MTLSTDIIQILLKAKSTSWGFTPHPTKEDCSSYPPWILQDAPDGVESPLGIKRSYTIASDVRP